jgi:6,7-dimethyl-8-ribityllumazine synthase
VSTVGKTFEGSLSAAGLGFGIVLSRFNDFFGEKLLEGALDTLRRSGADMLRVHVAHVPGAWELPIALKRMAQTKKYDALIALGVVIRGHTAHFEYVAGEAAKGASLVSQTHDLPVAFGVITVENIEQAIERSGSKAGNKGSEAAATAIEMANLLAAIAGQTGKTA